MPKPIIVPNYQALSSITGDLRAAYAETGDQATLGAMAAVLALNTEPSDVDDFFEKYDAALRLSK